MTLFSCQIDYSPAECDKSSPMLLKTFLDKLKEDGWNAHHTPDAVRSSILDSILFLP